MRDYPEIPFELLQAVRNDEENAWNDLIELLLPQIINIVRNQIRNLDDHDDIVQEVLVKIFMKLNQFNSSRPLRHWVSPLTVNTCYDWLRKYKARPLVTWADFDDQQRVMLERGMVTGDVSHEINGRIAHELLDKLIASLKPQEQVVIRLLELEENSVREVSELTGWGVSKVKVTAMRARRKMASYLAKLERNKEA